MNYPNCKLRSLFISLMIITLLLVLVSCGSKYSNILDGTWYEQEENGSVLVISGNEVTYSKNNIQYTSKFDAKETEKSIAVIMEAIRILHNKGE